MSAGTAGVLELTEQNFAPAIDGHPFAVVYFWAPSSAPCHAFAPTFAAAAARNPDVLFAKVNAENHQAIGAQFNVRSIPTLLIFRSNIIVYAKAGALQAGELDEVLGAARALDMEEVRRKVVSVDEVALGTSSAPSTDGGSQAAADTSLLSIETYLRPSLRGPGSALMDAVPRLAAGGLVAIRDAFEPEFAERMYRSLDTCTLGACTRATRSDFHYHHHNLYDASEFPADLAWCSKIFDSPSTKAWATRLSGRSCVGPAEFSASLVPSRRPFPPPQRCRAERRRTSIVKSPSCGIWQRIGGRSGAARCSGARRRATCRRSSTRCGSSTWGRKRPTS